MAAGSVSISITLPVTGANDPNLVGRRLAVEMLEQAAEQIGQLAQTSGNLMKTFSLAAGPTVTGTFSITPPTT